METLISSAPQIPPSLVRGGRKLPFHSTDVARHVALYGQNADAPHIFGGILSTVNGKQMMTMDSFERNGKEGCCRVTFGFVSQSPDGTVTIQAIIDNQGLEFEAVPLRAVVWESIEVFTADESSTNAEKMASLLTTYFEEHKRDFEASKEDVEKVSMVRSFLQCAVILTHNYSSFFIRLKVPH
jgi:hypothetical protein